MTRDAENAPTDVFEEGASAKAGVAQTSRPGVNRWALALLVLVGLLIVGLLATGQHRNINFAMVDELIRPLQAWVSDHLLLSAVLFMLSYAAAVVLIPPSGTVFTLTGGFVFGTLVGGSLVVVGATAGATLLFLVAKSALGNALAARAGPRLQKLEAGFQRDAFSYLLILRLVPLFPFWLVNIAPAFLGVRLWTYVSATAIGIVPATFVYASVGSGLSQLATAQPSLRDLLGPQFLLPALGLILLALLPVAYKRFSKRAR